jgi:hypothetical protein
MFETNNIKDSGVDVTISRRCVYWTTEGLQVTRLRLLSDPGYPEWDVSYCFGITKEGEEVRVLLPFSSLPKRGYKKVIVQEAIREGVYAKRLGILDDDVISLLC